VTSVTANRAPTLAVVPQTFTMADTENTDLVTPFSGVSFNDQNANDILTVRIALDTAGKGALVPVNGGSYDPETGVFTFVGSAQAAMAAIRALRFDATDRPTAPSGAVETTYESAWVPFVTNPLVPVTSNPSAVRASAVSG
jgi:hypothetical protein